MTAENLVSAELVPVSVRGMSYKKLCSMLNRKVWARAVGPCEISGEYHSRLYFYDHCHDHDYVRGVLCQGCNTRMTSVDSHIALHYEPEWLAYWERCPQCAASGPWQPLITVAESRDIRRCKDLVRLNDGTSFRFDSFGRITGRDSRYTESLSRRVIFFHIVSYQYRTGERRTRIAAALEYCADVCESAAGIELSPAQLLAMAKRYMKFSRV